MLAILLIFIIVYLSFYLGGLPYWLEPSVLFKWNTIIYIVLTVWYLYKFKRKNIICFELFFAISFWLCCFFLVFIIDDLGESLLNIMSGFGDELLCRASILSMLGYLLYMLGLYPIKIRNTIEKDDSVQSPLVSIMLNYLTLFFIILFFVKGGYYLMYAYVENVVVSGIEGGRFGRFGNAMTYAIICLNISTVSNIMFIKGGECNSFSKFIKNINKLYIFNMLVMSLFLLLCGLRSGAMQILLPFFAILSYKKIIKTKNAIGIIVLGVVTMSLIGLFRARTYSISEFGEEVSLLLLFRDFTSSNVATPSLMEYVDMYGSAHFRNALAQIFAIVPFMQSVVIGLFGNIFGSPSSIVFTHEIFNRYDSGMGTNIIGDLYYTGGILCVLILMYFLGWIVKRTSNTKNRYAILLLLCLVGNSVFMPRVEFFYIARTCSFSIIIYWFMNVLFPAYKSVVRKK